MFIGTIYSKTNKDCDCPLCVPWLQAPLIHQIQRSQPLALPPLLTLGFWMTVLALFLGYAIVIAVFFFIKSLFTGGRRRAHAH